MPQVRNWVREKFGSDDTKTLLNEEVVSDKELKTDIKKLEFDLREIENQMERHRKKYSQIIQQGAETSSQERKNVFARKAKREKMRYSGKKKQHQVKSVKLGTLISIETMREMMDLHQNEDTVIGSDIDADQIKREVKDKMSEFDVELEGMEEMNKVFNDLPIGHGVETEAADEIKEMDRVAQGKVSTEQIDIETEDDEISFDDEASLDELDAELDDIEQ